MENSSLIVEIITFLEDSRQPHYYCEDGWYNCPKNPEGSWNDAWKNGKCNCGADEYNKKLDELLLKLSL